MMAPWKASPISKGAHWLKTTHPLPSRPQVRAPHPVSQSFWAPSARQPSSQVHSLHLLSMGPSVLNPTKSVSSPPPVNLVQIPQAEALLHADCNGKEVTCEISYYFLQATEKAAWFITNVQVSGEGPDISMVMKTPRDAENGAVLHPTLNLPLSPRGTVQTAGEKIKSSRKEILGFFK